MEVITEELETTAECRSVEASASSELVSIEYYPMSVSCFSCFPALVIEGIELHEN